MKSQSILFVLCFVFLVQLSFAKKQNVGSSLPWMNLRDTPSDRAKKLLALMTFDEKLAMVHGYNGDYVGNVPALTISKTGAQIPAINLEDGPSGVADGVLKVTCFPSALTVVASFNPDSMKKYASALAQEQFGKGTTVMLGPMVNIARIPVGGRNFESFGEDPYLAAQMAEQSVYGIQNQTVIGCVKHWTDNNQEYNRTETSANVDERTQYEIYYPAFEAAVKAGVGSVMCSYNRINDTYACENSQTLNTDLKGRLGFQGWVMSDWGATHSTVKAANAGLDQQMPDDGFFGNALKKAIQNGQVPQSRLDDMVLRILTPMFAVGIFDTPNHGNLSVDVRSDAHTKLARELSVEGTILLKNEKNLLPINPSKIKTIAIIGDAGDKNPIVAGGGSGHVIPPYIISPYNGIRKRLSNLGVLVNYAPSSPLSQAVQTARNADIAIVCVGAESGEGIDRPNLQLGNGQDELIAAIAAVKAATVVVIAAPSGVLMPWVDSVPAILTNLMPGQEAGNALASILFGDHNPSGRLPVTFPAKENQVPANTPQQYPGINNEAKYSEKLLVGYRWYDAQQQTPLFPFGHGLSYTSFNYSDLQVDTHAGKISFKITNSGTVAGADIPQLYLGYPPSAGEPPKVLRGFSRVDLKPNQSHVLSFYLQDRDFSIWDITSHNWKLVTGVFNVYIGASSRDIRLKGVYVHP